MADIFEVSRKFYVPVAKLRKLAKAGYLVKVDDAESDSVAKMRFYLARKHSLTLKQVFALRSEPYLIEYLGRYAARARDQLDAIGDVEANAAPRDIAVLIEDAANNKADAIEGIAAWARGIIPAGEVSHHWLAARLVYNSPFRDEDLERVALALLNARRSPLLASWWRVEKGKHRSETFYARPKNSLANLDL